MDGRMKKKRQVRKGGERVYKKGRRATGLVERELREEQDGDEGRKGKWKQ
jgi:hypothetical protein